MNDTIHEIMLSMPAVVTAEYDGRIPTYYLTLLRFSEHNWMAAYHNDNGFPAVVSHNGAWWPLYEFKACPLEALKELKTRLTKTGILK